eukprot:UN3954
MWFVILMSYDMVSGDIASKWLPLAFSTAFAASCLVLLSLRETDPFYGRLKGLKETLTSRCRCCQTDAVILVVIFLGVVCMLCLTHMTSACWFGILCSFVVGELGNLVYALYALACGGRSEAAAGKSDKKD